MRQASVQSDRVLKPYPQGRIVDIAFSLRSTLRHSQNPQTFAHILKTHLGVDLYLASWEKAYLLASALSRRCPSGRRLIATSSWGPLVDLNNDSSRERASSPQGLYKI